MIATASRRSRAVLGIVAFGFIAAACGGASGGETSTGAQSATDDAASPSALFAGEFTDLNGQAVELASFEGQDVIMWFWAPW
ncbi:MAG: TlpA family protein disulfide reductase [Ilumatobacter sp.]